MKPGRNDPCPCGSGRKHKHCCASLSQVGTSPQPASQAPTANEQNHLIALYKAGRYAELEGQAGLFLKRYPDSGFGWKILSGALMAQGKDALHALQQTAKLLPQDAEVLNNLGDALAKQGKLEDATTCLQQALQLKPTYTDALYNLSLILERLRRYADAEQCHRKIIELKQDNADTHSNLGRVLIHQEQYIEAEIALRHALKLKPHLAETYANLGTALRMQKRHTEAETCFKNALEIDPDLIAGNSGLGGELMEQGRFAEAEQHFRRALSIQPHIVMPRFSLVTTKKIQPDDEDFKALLHTQKKTETKEESLSLNESIYLHFGLGKCFDDIENWDKAFFHYLEGCRLKHSSFQYDSNADSLLFDKIISVFNKEKIQQLQGSGTPSEQPIFILGMPRSGTTLTEQIIANHPDVHGAGELPDLLAITQRSIAGTSFPESLRLLDRSQLDAWGGEYAASLQRHAPQKKRITDKLPQNFLAVGLIHLMLPNAKIIHIERNPVDTCLSCFTMLFAGDLMKFSYDLAELGRLYANYARLMTHWRTTLPEGAFLEVKYENLVQNPEEETRRLIDYCELDWNAACLDFHKSNRAIRTASLTQARQPVYCSSIERWRHYEKHLGPLLDALGDLVPSR